MSPIGDAPPAGGLVAALLCGVDAMFGAGLAAAALVLALRRATPLPGAASPLAAAAILVAGGTAAVAGARGGAAPHARHRLAAAAAAGTGATLATAIALARMARAHPDAAADAVAAVLAWQGLHLAAPSALLVHAAAARRASAMAPAVRGWYVGAALWASVVLPLAAILS